MADEAISDKELSANKRPASAKASESGDPQVHILLGQRSVLEQNLAALDPPDNDQAIKDTKSAIKDIDDRLRELGYDV